MRILIIMILLPLSLLAAEPVVRPPQKPIDIGNVILTDGRVLHGAAVVSDTAHTITIRHDGLVEKIAKDLLPRPILQRWPVDPNREREEEYQNKKAAIAAKNAAMIKELQALHREKERETEIKMAKEEAAWRAEIYKRDHKNDGPAPKVVTAADREQLLRDAQAKELLLCRDSLRLTGFGFWDAKNAVMVKVKNPGDNPRQLEWRQLRALTPDGRVLEPGDVYFEVTDRIAYDVDRGIERRFNIVFPSATIAAVSWSDRPDLGWVNPQGKVVTMEVAMADARQRVINARLAKRSGGLQAVDGQLIAK